MSTTTVSPGSMRAARFHGNRDIRVESVPIPTLPAPDTQGGSTPSSDGNNAVDAWHYRPRVVVEVAWCGICGSDLHEFLEGPTIAPQKGNPHPLTGEHLPSILGHEFCGTISQASPKSRFKVGQKVMVDPRLVCHSCPPHEECSPCLTKNDHFCPKLGFLGYSGCGGGFAEYVTVEEEMLFVLPDNVPLNFAALAEPITVAHHALKRTGFDSYVGKTALIVGGGPVGYAVILSLKAAGCKTIIVSEPTARRREDVARFVERVVDPRSGNVGNECRDATKGLGVDVAFDCAGVQSGLDAAVDALKKGGWWVNISVWPNFPVIPFWGFMAKELNMTVSCAYNKQDFAEVMDNLRQGKYPGFEKMVTSRIHLEDVVDGGFVELTENKDKHVKIMVTPKRELLE